ncbi:MAG: cysteine desulfurase family protein [Patescibacteria group bacterium]
MFSSFFRRFGSKFQAIKRHPKRIYADYATLTPINGNVLSLMSTIYKKYGQNPGALYGSAVTAKKVLETARKGVAELLSGPSLHSVHADEIVFTTGGTEANNIAILGVVENWYEKNTEIPTVIISNIEHPAVKKIVENLERKKKINAFYIPVTEEGVVDLVELKKVFAEQKNIILVSVMLVNNEIGTIHPLKEIAKVIRNYRKENSTAFPYFHTDACQAPCYVDMPIDKLGVDLLTLDGGKIYGPRGVGCLYMKRGTELNSPYIGGGQEKGIRPGTENLPAIVGFAEALHIVFSKKEKEVKRLAAMQEFILSNLPEHVFVNGSLDKEKRIVNNINICIPGTDSEFLVFKMDVAGVEVSAVTACQNSQEESRSTVVDALGKNCGGSSLRISLGQGTTWGEVKKIVKVLYEICE